MKIKSKGRIISVYAQYGTKSEQVFISIWRDTPEGLRASRVHPGFKGAGVVARRMIDLFSFPNGKYCGTHSTETRPLTESMGWEMNIRSKPKYATLSGSRMVSND